ncbi:MAG: PDZ domain-containing protein, partial [Candidatus Binataceae bacterium]
ADHRAPAAFEPSDPYAVPSTTVEIAPAVAEPQLSQTPSLTPDPDIDNQSPTVVNNPEVRDYEQHQAGMESGPTGMGPGSMQTYLSEDAISSPIGIQLREARRTLKSGEEADGLLITEVTKGSPAAVAGLHGSSRAIHNVLLGVMIVGALAFPPAIVGVPLLDYTQIGESYDLIIGVDGARVTDFLDFQDRMRDLKPGEIVYLSVVRDGHRHQFRVGIPVGTNLASW